MTQNGPDSFSAFFGKTRKKRGVRGPRTGQEHAMAQPAFFSKENGPEHDEPLYMGEPRQHIVIASTPRVGSTLLAKGLTGAGAAPVFGEFFNRVHRSDFVKRWGLLSKEEYVRQLYRHRTTPDGIFAVKAHFSQFEAFMDLMPEASRCRYVFIERENKILQAVSFFLGTLSGRWASGQQAKRRITEDDYDFATIYAHLADILGQNIAWVNFFNSNGIAPMHVVYERLAAQHETTVREVCAFVRDQNGYAGAIKPPALKRQRTPLNDVLYWKFVEELTTKNKWALAHRNFLFLHKLDACTACR